MDSAPDSLARQRTIGRVRNHDAQAGNGRITKQSGVIPGIRQRLLRVILGKAQFPGNGRPLLPDRVEEGHVHEQAVRGGHPLGPVQVVTRLRPGDLPGSALDGLDELVLRLDQCPQRQHDGPGNGRRQR